MGHDTVANKDTTQKSFKQLFSSSSIQD